MYFKKNKQFISKNINSNFFQNNNEPLIYYYMYEIYAQNDHSDLSKRKEKKMSVLMLSNMLANACIEI